MEFLAHTNITQKIDQEHLNMPLLALGEEVKVANSEVAVKI